MNKKVYDFILPLGEACFSASIMKKHNLRTMSCPFDWMYGADFESRYKIFLNKFENFFNRQDFDFGEDDFVITLQGEKYSNLKDCYNKRTGIHFNHDFFRGEDIEDAFLRVKAKYQRRIKRTLDTIDKSKKILLLYIDLPNTKRGVKDNSVLVDLLNQTKEAYPNKEFDILYIKHNPDLDTETVIYDNVNENITVVTCFNQKYGRHNPLPAGSTDNWQASYEACGKILGNLKLRHDKINYIKGKYNKFLSHIRNFNKKLKTAKNNSPYKKDLMTLYPSIPSDRTGGFNSVEVSMLLDNFSNSANYSLNKRQFPIRNEYCVIQRKNKFKFNLLKNKYIKLYPNTKGKLFLLDMNKKYSAKLAYGIFLNVIYMYLPFLEKNKIPFVFTIYPGGGGMLDNPLTDKMLKEVLSSKYFRRVIVSMPVLKNYLIQKGFTSEDKIEYIYGTPQQNKKGDFAPRTLFYNKNKSTFDVCFCAYRYSKLGKDKGYDVFIDVAKITSKKNKNVHFHIIGPWDSNVIDIKGYEDNIHFYGVQNSGFFKEFYPKMDIFLSPNRNGILFEGSFDGFPLGAEAALAGVYLMASDPLNMKKDTPLKDCAELEIIDTNPYDISDRILSKLNNLDKFYLDCLNLQEKISSLCDKDKILKAQYDVIKKELNAVEKENNG